MKNGPRFKIVLEARGDTAVAAEIRLRSALKSLGRKFGFKCLSVTDAFEGLMDGDEMMHTVPVPEADGTQVKGKA